MKILKATLITLLLFNMVACAQNKKMKTENIKKQSKYNTPITLVEGETIVFSDSFKITLRGFNHKKTFDPQESYEFGLLEIKENNQADTCIIGRQVQKDELDRYVTVLETVDFTEHQIILTNWIPFEIKVFKKNSEYLYTHQEKYNTKIRLRENHLVVLPDGLKIEVGDFLWSGDLGDLEMDIDLKFTDNNNKISTFKITRKEYYNKQKTLVTDYESNIEIPNYKIDILKENCNEKKANYDFLDIKVIKLAEEKNTCPTQEDFKKGFENLKQVILKKGRKVKIDGNKYPNYKYKNFEYRNISKKNNPMEIIYVITKKISYWIIKSDGEYQIDSKNYHPEIVIQKHKAAQGHFCDNLLNFTE